MATQIDEQRQQNAAVEEQHDTVINGGDMVDHEASMNEMLDGLQIKDTDNNSNEAKEMGKEEEPNGKGNEEKLVSKIIMLIKNKFKSGKYFVVASAMIRVMTT